MASRFHIPSACFLIDADTQVHPKSSKESGFQDNTLCFCMTGDMKINSDEERRFKISAVGGCQATNNISKK